MIMEDLLFPEEVRYVEENLPEEEDLYNLAEFYKMFADSTRVRILSALAIHGVSMILRRCSI